MAEANATKIVRLETQMKNVVDEIGEVKGLVKELIVKVDNFATVQNEINVLHTEISSLKGEITNLKRRNNVLGWVYPTATAVFTALITYLIIEFFKDKR